MIVSHRNGFVFMHVPKTAGTAISIALTPLCGSEDIIAAWTPHNDEFRDEVPGWRDWPQNARVPVSKLTPRQTVSCVRRQRLPRYGPHTHAKEARKLIGARRWNRYLTFAVERNPWDKAVSSYFFKQQTRSDVNDFPSFLRSAPRRFFSDPEIYCIDGSLAVDRVLRFERLTEYFSDMCDTMGLEIPVLPDALTEYRPAANRDWRPMYSDADAEFVAEVCATEIELFGYTFDDVIK